MGHKNGADDGLVQAVVIPMVVVVISLVEDVSGAAEDRQEDAPAETQVETIGSKMPPNGHVDKYALPLTQM